MSAPNNIKTIVSYLLIFISINIFSQSSTKESLSFGIGVSNFSMHGDLRSIETGTSNSKSNLMNLGAYIYVDKMISPAFGFEAKFNYSKMSGSAQELSSTYRVGNNIPLNSTWFEGSSYGGEINTIINLSGFASNPYRMQKRKWNFAAFVGIGLHRYDSKLYDIETNELLLDYGNSPSKNGSTSSMYYTSGLSIKYKINSKIDIELRQDFNLNEEDHLDAATSNKQAQDFFFKTNLGIVFKLNDKKHDNFIWQDDLTTNFNESEYLEILDKVLKDTDGDGVIDRLDKEKNTPKNVAVYGNGVAIDSDKDGIPDYKDSTPMGEIKKVVPVVQIDTDGDGIMNKKDKCPTIYAKTKDGCPKKVDTDGDGVTDDLDKCPTIYAPNGDGCPKKIKTDSDKDGIVDSKDKCPLLFAKTKNGCPDKIDADGDGITDEIDKCPNTYAKTKDGCPKKLDRDNDGVPDSIDKCPRTYANTTDGCPKIIDTDGDGVPDNIDECPTVYAKTKDGCAKIIDTDKDGVPDDFDKCPKTYAKTKNGCPKRVDSDGDGISDAFDKCPKVYAETGNGCPEKKDSDGDGISDLFDKCPKIYAKTGNGCPDSDKPTTATEEAIKKINKKNVTHKNSILNNALNVNDVTTSPVLPDCKHKVEEFDKKNCMITEISKYVISNYNTDNAQRINGKVRVLFVVKEDGSTQVVNIISSKINADSKQELKRVIESIPKMKPGLLNNIPVPVKYSLRFDLR